MIIINTSINTDTDDDGLIDGYCRAYPDLNSEISSNSWFGYTYADMGWSTVLEFTSKITVINGTGNIVDISPPSQNFPYAVGEIYLDLNPAVSDEDNDGLSDGAEIFSAKYLEHSTSPINPDTDNDGIGDKAEWEAYWWAYESNYGDGNKSLWVNPLVYDAYNDSDSDGLTNIEEWERSGYIMDYDRDDIPNFYDTDDDKDGLPTSVELSANLNPFDIADAREDKDGNRLDIHNGSKTLHRN